jgi:SAM-dependent methyltransferase
VNHEEGPLRTETGSTDRRHYSYEVYEDPSTALGFDIQKFGGPVGRMIKEYQEEIITLFLNDVAGSKILDLGAGTGRTAIPLSMRGAWVTAVDASFPMLQIVKEKSWLQGGSVRCTRGDAHQLPFRNREFDTVISLRMLMHVIDWKKTISEICRISRNNVLIDFPPAIGFAGLAPLVHPVRKLINRKYQSYRVYTIHSVVRELCLNGYRPAAVDRHLVLPFGLHRLLGSVNFTVKIESVLKRLGLTDILGAPVTIMAERMDRS